MKKKVGIALALFIFATLGASYEIRPFTPQLKFGVLWMGEEETLIGIKNLGWRPVWTFSRNDFVISYSIQYYGDIETKESHVFATTVRDPELELMRSRTMAMVSAPRNVTHIRIGIVVVDWRGRETSVTSEKIAVHRQFGNSPSTDTLPSSSEGKKREDDVETDSSQG